MTDIWNFISANFLTLLFGFVAIIACYYAWRAINTKKLEYLMSFDPIISIKSNIQYIEITFKGKKISDLSLVKIELTNKGNQPILVEDFKNDLNFYLQKESKVLQISSLEPKEVFIPEDYLNSVEVKNNHVKLKPLLINQKSSLKILLLVENISKTEIDWSKNSIVGVQKIEKNSLYSYIKFFAITIYPILIFLFLYFVNFGYNEYKWLLSGIIGVFSGSLLYFIKNAN